jgi:hypothetical protein
MLALLREPDATAGARLAAKDDRVALRASEGAGCGPLGVDALDVA